MPRLSGKVALITGAAGGQGASHARLFAQEGASVVIADVREAEGREVASSLGDQGAFVSLDVSEEAQWAAAVRTAIEAFGKLDVLVNNAGITGGGAIPLEQTPLELFDQICRVNQVGTFLGIKSCVGPMIEAGGGSIVNIASTIAIIPRASFVGYTASKWAVRGISKAAAVEYASRGIRVNAIFPGFINTPMVEHAPQQVRDTITTMIPMRRPGEPVEISPLVVMLASDESSYVTGAELVVDGGLTSDKYGGLGELVAAPSAVGLQDSD